ncbi:MAG: hypothetical protein M3509_02055 [Chloroflexota bacterium]|nr:hypothetical protein [Chloroflexota bacterium]
MKKLFTTMFALTFSVLMTGAALAQDATETPVVDDVVTPVVDPVTPDDNNNWGLFGLIGLAGLAGLLRRPNTEVRTVDRVDRTIDPR